MSGCNLAAKELDSADQILEGHNETKRLHNKRGGFGAGYLWLIRGCDNTSTMLGAYATVGV